MRIASLRRSCCFGLVVVVGSLVGCEGPRYLYRPEENATASVAGRPAAFYQIPPESPRGDVRVATLGVVRLQVPGQKEDVRAMHARLVVDNNDETPWTVDTREQIGALQGAGQSRPAFAGSSVGGPPIITIAPHYSASVDLYYPLPASMQEASEIPRFDVLWHVNTAERAVAERTSFERLRIEYPGPADWQVGVGWWGPGWYDPFWPSYTFYGGIALPPAYYPAPVVHAAPPPVAPPAIRVR
ncbi:MAG TPA: hypothetical protein VE987_16160 [Polyangiaceae bacterium]|nr:hypothetical protein [Polyangiaceae bacterium]